VRLRETGPVGHRLGGDDVFAQVRPTGDLGLDGEPHRLQQVFAEQFKFFRVNPGKVNGHGFASYGLAKEQLPVFAESTEYPE
jgi:hypothetical protein